MKKEFDNIDELLRSILEDHTVEPSAGVWKRIAGKLNFTRSTFYLSLLAIFLTLAVLVYLIAVPGSNPTDSDSKSNKVTVSSGGEATPVIAEKQKVQHAERNVKTENHQQDQEVIRKIRTTNLPENIEKKRENPTEPASESHDAKFKESGNYFELYPNLERLSTYSKEINQIPTLLPIFYTNILKYNHPLGFRTDFRNLAFNFTADYGPKINLMIGIHFTPEMVFTGSSVSNREPAYNAGFSLYYFKNDWFVQGGAGLGITKEKSLFDINYAQYDSVGYYYHVKSFEINDLTGEPIFNTEAKGVWDTVEYNTREPAKNKFTYLRIPVYAGVMLRQFKRLSLWIEGGGIYSVLLDKQLAKAQYNNERATEININKLTPTRIESNFQLSAGIALHFQVGRNIIFTAEPLANYYVKPIYKPEGTGSTPWSLGFRSGFIFKFNAR